MALAWFVASLGTPIFTASPEAVLEAVLSADAEHPVNVSTDAAVRMTADIFFNVFIYSPLYVYL
jgi:hypothetical protein